MNEMETTLEINEEDTKQYIAFTLNEQLYGIEISVVQVIERLKSITRIPKAPKSVVGVFNLRGEIIPVLSLRLKFGLEEKAFDDKTRIIIIRLGESSVGLIVDEVKEVLEINEEEIEKVEVNQKGDSQSQNILGVGKLEDNIITLLKVQNILDEAFGLKLKK